MQTGEGGKDFMVIVSGMIAGHRNERMVNQSGTSRISGVWHARTICTASRG
jgi:hypothetical protein